jgi:hypothetical protein
VSQLSRKCGIINISQAYRPPRPVTGIALLIIIYIVIVIGDRDCSFGLDTWRPRNRGSTMASFSQRPHWLLGPHSLQSTGCRGSLRGYKAAGEWSPCSDTELYLRSSRFLHGVVLREARGQCNLCYYYYYYSEPGLLSQYSDIAIGYGLDGRLLGVRFPAGFCTAFLPAMESKLPSVDWEAGGGSSPGLKWPGPKADHSPSFSDESQEWWATMYNSTS